MKLFELWSLKQCKILPYNFVVSKPALSRKQIKWKIVCWSESIYDFLAQVNFQVFSTCFLWMILNWKYLSPALSNFLINYVWIIRSATGRLIVTFWQFYKAQFFHATSIGKNSTLFRHALLDVISMEKKQRHFNAVSSM